LFDTVEGNIRFRAKKHDFVNGRCKWCGASAAQFDRDDGLESHAYEFIHTDKPEEIFNMKFDVIVGNPPYQMSFGLDGGNSSNAKSIYNLFIDKAMLLRPRYITMITPSRWMTKTAQGIPDSWVEKMLQCNHFRVLHDFEDVCDCFPGVSIKGGVNYFLIEMDYEGKCEYYFHQAQGSSVLRRIDYLDSKKTGIVIRDSQSYSIIDKIESLEGKYYLGEGNFSALVSAKHFFDDSSMLTSNWRGYEEYKTEEFTVKYYLNLDRERTYKWIKNSQIPKNYATKNLHKVYIPAAGGTGNDDQVLGRPFYGEPNSVCSQTYLVIGYDPERHNFSKKECLNIISYIKTRFFRYLVSIKKKTQNGPRGVYQFVPIQDFSKPWTDEELYMKYNLTKDEIAFIESMIKPME
jgi:site-specific DNA-methyltransferase (adenine-specific)